MIFYAFYHCINQPEGLYKCKYYTRTAVTATVELGILFSDFQVHTLLSATPFGKSFVTHDKHLLNNLYKGSTNS